MNNTGLPNYKGLDFRDDCTEFVLSVSIYSLHKPLNNYISDRGHYSTLKLSYLKSFRSSSLILSYSLLFVFNYKARDITNQKSQFTEKFGPA